LVDYFISSWNPLKVSDSLVSTYRCTLLWVLSSFLASGKNHNVWDLLRSKQGRWLCNQQMTMSSYTSVL
jgi:hypothetical protein